MVEQTRAKLTPMLGKDELREAALDAWSNEGYRYAGTVILDAFECFPDCSLEIAWARTQNVADDHWRIGQRSSVAGDIFAVDRSLYVIAPRGFLALTHDYEPKIVRAKVGARDSPKQTVMASFDNGEERAIFSYHASELAFRAKEFIGLTERDACHLHHEKSSHRHA